MSNHIYLYSNSSKESVSEIKGLNIVFKGKNSEVMIEEGVKFYFKQNNPSQQLQNKYFKNK